MQEQVTVQLRVGGITSQAVPLQNGKIGGRHCSQVDVVLQHCVRGKKKKPQVISEFINWNVTVNK